MLLIFVNMIKSHINCWIKQSEEIILTQTKYSNFEKVY